MVHVPTCRADELFTGNAKELQLQIFVVAWTRTGTYGARAEREILIRSKREIDVRDSIQHRANKGVEGSSRGMATYSPAGVA